MGGGITATTYRKAESQEELMRRFARIMKQRYGATVYMFGSRARGTAELDSDYDFVAVSRAFSGRRRTERVQDRFRLWLEAGGWGEGLDLHCLTPEEFHRETKDGIGYLGEARRRGELIRVLVGARDRNRGKGEQVAS